MTFTFDSKTKTYKIEWKLFEKKKSDEENDVWEKEMRGEKNNYLRLRV